MIKLLIHLVLPCLLVVRFSLALLVAILSFSYRFFQSFGFIEFNLVFVGLRQSTQKALDFYLLIFNILGIPQHFQERFFIFLHGLLSQSHLMEFFDFIIVVSVREVLLLEIFLELFPDNLPFVDLFHLHELFPPNRHHSSQVKDGYPILHISIIVLDLEIFSHTKNPSVSFLPSIYLTIEGRQLCLLEFIL